MPIGRRLAPDREKSQLSPNNLSSLGYNQAWHRGGWEEFSSLLIRRIILRATFTVFAVKRRSLSNSPKMVAWPLQIGVAPSARQMPSAQMSGEC